MALRLQRRAAFGWPATPAPSADTDHGMAVHYEGGVTGIASWEHARCVEHWNRTRRFHMNTRGWLDIGYAWGVCPHFVLEGRGGFRAQAAQPGGNTTWESCTFMTGPGEKPHPGQVENFRALRAWRMSKGVARAIRPHSSFSATSCPGDVLRAMITDGTLFRAPQGDDMPTIDEIVAALADPDGDFIRRVGNVVSRRVLERFAEDASLSEAARQKIAREALYRVRADQHHVRVHGPDADLNLLTRIDRVGQLIHAHLGAQPTPDPEPTPEPM